MGSGDTKSGLWPNVASAGAVASLFGGAVWKHELVVGHPIPAAALLVGGACAVALVRFAGPPARQVRDYYQRRATQAVAETILVRLSGHDRRYRRWIITYLNRVDLRGLITVPSAPPSFDDVYVDVDLVERSLHKVKVDLVNYEPGGHRRSIDTWLSGDDPVALMVIGAPGSGKTTLLRHVALLACRKRYGRRTVPVLLSLREHVDAIARDESADLAELAAAAGPKQLPADWFRSRLEHGRCVVLLDGLDEMPARRRVATLKWAQRQIHDYARNHFVVTSRKHGYAPAAIDAATVLQTCQFTPAQSARFAHAWYQSAKGSDAEAAEFLAKVDSHAALRALAVNPLLLTMMVNVHRERQSLPDSRVQLYREICEVLLWRRREVKKLPATFGQRSQQHVLQALALAMMLMPDRVRELPERRAREIVAPVLSRIDDAPPAAAFLTTAAQDGMLIRPEPDVIMFAHPTFQEFLAALEIHDRGRVDILADNVEDDWWYETTLFYAAEREADAIVEACLRSQSVAALALAFDCVESRANLAPALRARLTALLDEPTTAAADPDRRDLFQIQLTRHLRKVIDTVDDKHCVPPIPRALFRLFLVDNDIDDRSAAQARPELPAACVRFDEAAAFTEWANLLLETDGYRLPGAAEVADLAARGLLGTPAHTVWLEPHEQQARLWTPEGVEHPYDFELADAVDESAFLWFAIGNELATARDLVDATYLAADKPLQTISDIETALGNAKAWSAALHPRLAADLAELETRARRVQIDFHMLELKGALDETLERHPSLAVGLATALAPYLRVVMLPGEPTEYRSRAYSSWPVTAAIPAMAAVSAALKAVTLPKSKATAETFRATLTGALVRAAGFPAGTPPHRPTDEPLPDLLDVGWALMTEKLAGAAHTGRLADQVIQVAAPVFRRTGQLSPMKAGLVRLAALCLAADAEAEHDSAAADIFRRVAVEVTVLERIGSAPDRNPVLVLTVGQPLAH
ncbi:MAG: NACHT domain-containing protein [Mycobacteriaceae bacterium]|nr:NACHT domain-containing protein [Mycobacteriaceae bacterium]